jgi:hypothetical protein
MDFIVKSRVFGKMIASVDDEDYQRIKDIAWYIDKSKRQFYLKAKIRVNGKLKGISMHRYIMNFPKKGIDHKDGNGLNNKKNNLRICTNKQNSRNSQMPTRNTTGFKGVRFAKKEQKYHARVVVNGNMISGGLYTNILRAAKKYNEMALQYFGEFAKLNEFTAEQMEYLLTPYIKEKRMIKPNKTGYIGVYRVNKNKPYRAEININKKQIGLGYFHTAELAAKAYNDAAIKYKKENANLNIIPLCNTGY